MATKSIKVKLRLGKHPDIRAGIWQLHKAANAGVRYYTEWLSLMRQKNLYTRGPKGEQQLYRSGEQCRRELLQRLRERQRLNGRTDEPGTDEELLKVARQIYEVLVPQSIGKSGDAQQLASNFLSPLVDPNSKGGQGQSNAGRKPAWQKMRDEGNPGWVAAKERYEQRKATDPTKKMIEMLDGLGLKPLFSVFTETYTTGVKWKDLSKRQGVRTWDRDMFQQALERLMSWESWNRRVGQEYARLLEQKRKFEEEHFTDQAHLVELVRTLEEDIRAASQGFASTRETAYQITRRALRGFERVIETWSRLSPEAPFREYDEAIRKVQSELRRNFGSHDLFARLAEPKYQPLWREDKSFLARYALYNGVLQDLENAKQFATFTLPDAHVNPIWIRFENATGKNIHKYEFLFDHFGPGRHAVRFPRLLVVQDGLARETESVTVEVAPSAQLDKLRPRSEETSKIAVSFHDAAHTDGLVAELAGAKLQYARQVLERKARRDKERLHPTSGASFIPLVPAQETGQDAGDVFFNVSIRIDSESERQGNRRPPYATVFRIEDNNRRRVTLRAQALAEYLQEHPDERVPGTAGLTSGLRVMTVDLGFRTSASVSVFRVAKRSEVADGTGRQHYFSIAGVDEYVAVHERSHLLQMPGETESPELRRLREMRLTELRQLKSQLQVLRLLVRAGTAEERMRARAWQRLVGNEAKDRSRLSPTWKSTLEAVVSRLQGQYGQVSDEAWRSAVEKAVNELWMLMAEQVRDWRKRIQSRDKVKVKGWQKDVVGGNSLAHIDYLEQQYRFLRSWSFFARESGQVRRAERDSRFAVALRRHIDNAKNDRLKKLADRILMEALGYVYEVKSGVKGRWVAKHPPCQLVVLEELSAYRFNEDRPPSENSKLMRWGHRGILEELVNQAQVHDVLVGTVPAAFSSRFDARTGAPGVRCRRVPARFTGPVAHTSLPGWLMDFLERHKLHPSWIRPGDLVPTGEGEFLVSPNGDGGFRQVHADINAAQNLQKRLWQHFDLADLRLRCDKKGDGDETVFVPRLTTGNKRIVDQYKKTVFVQRGPVTYVEQARRTGERAQADVSDLTEEELEVIAEADEAREKSIVLFRDPSNQVNRGRWTSQKEFWSMVNQKIESYAVQRIRSRATETSDSMESGL
ncbi:MAG: type V CRISPR-associated protein Cas12b [Alicyclobacillus herbarius]|uniref:type V CRISPR-associated protein Cas12b n=1 Tax=Alicyclobacillus herbarius TaxID=122960 RepID=UPI0023551C1E|nr:type V CRISPR-associated protein Cas12b [Alicyclobacillus herbarius]MCL6632093.1 type V CRISPR-associated protein Cas12b [Alicyclobacillus herbarius]